MLAPDQDEEGGQCLPHQKFFLPVLLSPGHPPPLPTLSGCCPEGFDHSRFPSTVVAYANEAATLTPPSCPEDQLRETGGQRGRVCGVSPNHSALYSVSSPGKVPESSQRGGAQGIEKEALTDRWVLSNHMTP